MRTSTVLGRNWELMLRLYENIAISQVTKENTNVVSRAVSKAFDKVWHSGLKYKLSITEIPELIIKILASYITNRTAQLKIGNHIGPKFELLSGVPCTRRNPAADTVYFLRERYSNPQETIHLIFNL